MSRGKLLFNRSWCSERFLCYLAADKQKRDKRPRDKGPVIRDGVRPVPRLASRTITLRKLESVFRLDPILREEENKHQTREKERWASLFSHLSLHLSSSFFPISSLCASYFVNRMITRLRSRAPRATCSRSAGVEGEYILSGEVPAKRGTSHNVAALAWATSEAETREEGSRTKKENRRAALLLYERLRGGSMRALTHTRAL